MGGDGATDGVGNDVIGNVLTGNAGYAIKVMRTPQGTVCGNTIRDVGHGTISVASVRNPDCPTPGPAAGTRVALRTPARGG